MSETDAFLLKVTDLHFGWGQEPDFLIVDDFSMQRGSHVFLEGPSGSGKSTLLGMIAGVLSPRSGAISMNGKRLDALSMSDRDKLRADSMGVIFQLFNLLPYLSMIDNVLLPCRFSSKRRENVLSKADSLEDEARRLLSRLGLPTEMHTRKVSNLSVGQQQRVAAARAFIGSPNLIIADEPTSSVDTAARDAFLALLMEEASATNAGLLFVSHDRSLASAFQTQVSLTDLNTASKETV